jgi:hypothetical protein
VFRSLCTTSAQGVASRWTHYQQSLYARALPKSAAAGHRGAPICSQAARWWLAPHGGPRPWPRPADEGVARTCGAAEQRLDSVLAGQPRPRGDTYSAGLAFRLADSQV